MEEEKAVWSSRCSGGLACCVGFNSSGGCLKLHAWISLPLVHFLLDCPELPHSSFRLLTCSFALRYGSLGLQLCSITRVIAKAPGNRACCLNHSA